MQKDSYQREVPARVDEQVERLNISVMRKVYFRSWLARLLPTGKSSTVMLFGKIHTKSADALSETDIRRASIFCEQYEEVTLLAFIFAMIISGIFGPVAWPFILAPLLYYIIWCVEAVISWVRRFLSKKKKDAESTTEEAASGSMFRAEADEGESDSDWIQTRKLCHWLKYFGRV